MDRRKETAPAPAPIKFLDIQPTITDKSDKFFQIQVLGWTSTIFFVLVLPGFFCFRLAQASRYIGRYDHKMGTVTIGHERWYPLPTNIRLAFLEI